MNLKQPVMDMILTSLTNNDDILDNVIDDVELRFHLKLNKEQLRRYLSAADITAESVILGWKQLSNGYICLSKHLLTTVQLVLL